MTIEDADGAINDQVDEAYKAKYRRYAANIVGTVVSGDAERSTLRLLPSPG